MSRGSVDPLPGRATGDGLRITPLDIRNHAFRRRVSGYDREDVDAFLGMVADDFEGLIRELETLRHQKIRLEAKVEELSSHEAILQETLTTAQRLSQDLKQTAVKEAESLIGEAEIRGEKILDAAHRRAAKLAEDIREMKNLRCRLAAALRATIETHLGLLEGLAEDPPDEPLLESTIASLAAAPREARRGRKP
jgi:cell division initiation protein